MFERFTDRARRVIVLAQEEALAFDHAHIGTEHLVLGLFAKPEGGTQAVAERLGLDIDSLRADLEREVGRGDGPTGSHIPFTPGAKTALEMSLREALKLGHGFIGAEHILLGVLTQSDEPGARLLAAAGPSLDQIREAVADVIDVQPAMVSDRPPGRELTGILTCVHPDAALRWNVVEVPGDDGARSLIVVRCTSCSRAISVLTDPGGSEAVVGEDASEN